MPWPWEAARYCLDMQTGKVLHFPAGTYNQQIGSAIGRTQLDMMTLCFEAWRSFSKTDIAEFSSFDVEVRRIAMEFRNLWPAKKTRSN